MRKLRMLLIILLVGCNKKTEENTLQTQTSIDEVILVQV